MPPNVRVDAFFAYHHLLPRVDVVVTNAGYGGVQFALAHGVPLVAAGRTEEKAEICARIAWSGVGIDLRKHSPSPRAVRRSISLDEPIGQWFQENPPAAGIDVPPPIAAGALSPAHTPASPRGAAQRRRSAPIPRRLRN